MTATDKAVIITMNNGVPEVAHCSEGVQVFIIGDSSHDIYTWKNSLVKISKILDDGLVDIKIVTPSKDHIGSRSIFGVPVIELEWYADEDDDFDMDDDEDFE